MRVTRRVVIKQFLFASAGIALIPSCMQDKSKASIILKKLVISPDQEAMLAEISETIIPKTESPGAKDISAHLFVLKMVDDCFKKEDQQRFVKGLQEFDKKCRSTTGKSFIDCDLNKRNQVIAELDGKKKAEDDISYFYGATKYLTTQAYTSSEFYMTKIRMYKMIPGKFKGSVPV